jgi:hypothetical protein
MGCLRSHIKTRIFGVLRSSSCNGIFNNGLPLEESYFMSHFYTTIFSEGIWHEVFTRIHPVRDWALIIEVQAFKNFFFWMIFLILFVYSKLISTHQTYSLVLTVKLTVKQLRQFCKQIFKTLQYWDTSSKER